jgi:GNAT superfamily N-acetyltransferase
MHLREAVATDAETIALLHTASWRDAYSNVLDATYLAGPIEQERLAYWKSELVAADAGQRVILAEDEDNAVGFICVRWPGSPAWGAWVGNLHVGRASRGKGAGKQRLKAAATWVTSIDAQSGLYLWVFEANEPALSFYEHLGGEIVEKSSSEIPAANGAPIVRVWWPRATHLLDC